MFYYEVHVFFRRNQGYSFGLSSLVELLEEEVIEEAIKQNKFTEKGDEDYVDYVENLTEDEYKKYFNE